MISNVIENEDFIDSNIYEAYKSFKIYYLNQSTKFKRETKYRHLKTLRKSLLNRNVDEINWMLICSIAKDEELSTNEKQKIIRITLLFMVYVAKYSKLNLKDKEQFIKNEDSINDFFGHVSLGYTNNLNEYKTSASSIYSWNNGKLHVVGIIETKNEFLLSIFKKYLKETPLLDHYKIKNAIRVFSYFEESISPYVIKSFEDFNDEVFIKSIKNVDIHFGIENRHFLTTRVLTFYQWLVNEMSLNNHKNNFDFVDTVVLSYLHIIGRIMEGYTFVKYNPYDDVKYIDKMILIPSSDEFHDKGESYRVYPFDASTIQNTRLKRWYIEYFWECDITLKNRKKVLFVLLNFLEDYDKKISKELDEIIFNESDISRFVSNCISRGISNAGTSTLISQIKKFLEFLEDKEYMEVKPILYRLLVYKDSQPDVNKEPYTAEEINRIINYLKDKKPLHALGVAIIANSEIRKESLLKLKTDCLVKTLSREDGAEYAVKVHTKRSENQLELININRYVKSFIDECIEFTSEIRKNMNSYDKDYIFIHLQEGREIPKRFKSESIATEINKACRILKIEPLGTAGIRNNYMQANSNIISDKKKNHSIIPALTGHTLSVHTKYYDQVDIVQFCEYLYMVNIGNVELRGEVKENTNYSRENTVANSCGYCKSDHCSLNGNLDCFMCKNFVTTLSCIPFFEKEIARIDNKIVNESISHEKDFLLSKKKLLVGYLSQLLVLKGESY